MLKKRADVQEIGALFTASPLTFIQGPWQMLDPGQLLCWGIRCPPVGGVVEHC